MIDAGINWLPFQSAWIEDQTPFKIGNVARRSGKTFCGCGEVVLDCWDAEVTGRKARWTIMSHSEDAAKNAVTDAVEPISNAIVEANNLRGKFSEPVFEQSDFYNPELDIRETKTEMRFPGGTKIISLTGSTYAARNFGGNLLLDEFAFFDDCDAVWALAYPTAVLGGHKIRIISTQNRQGDKFGELISTQDSVWSRHRVDIYEAVKQGLVVDLEKLRTSMDDGAWRREFELTWQNR